MTQDDELKVVRRESHAYGQSDVGYNRPVCLSDFLPMSNRLDTNKSYMIFNGVAVEIKEPK